MTPNTLTKILVVDDDEDTLTITKYCLKTLQGVEVRYVSSGEAAIKEVFQFHPDLILLDVMMPQMDGMTALKILKQTETTAHIPVVFFTAKIQEKEIAVYLQAGAIDVITKPFDPLLLSSTILNIWEKYQKPNP